MTVKNGLYIDDEGNRKWYKDSKLHRDNGPAVEWVNGDRWWCKDSKLHREDGPAIEYANGNHWRYKTNGILHGNDHADELLDSLRWWYHDREYSFEEWCQATQQTPEAITLLRLKYNC